ncbi:MAG: Hsp20/alpha crystallin family protein [Gammaproteobacteria bacterium]|nr:Hsp20/alpha crystallin family protein [Gammaproteobacteria bacterium]MDE2347424.1 Hsp20/alpha crystallin family protein [Gammaproteobacteria bacterium]
MNLIRWEPLREFEDFYRRYAAPRQRNATDADGDSDWTPLANIMETGKEYVIKAELPETKREDVKISLQNGVITIAGERKHVQQDKDEHSLRIESFYGSFSRSFVLPDNVNAEAIHAESKDGVLTVHIPKKPESTAQKIEIAVK